MAQTGTAGTYGTFAIDADGAWTYTASSAHNEFVAGTTYTDTFDVSSADGTLTSVTVNILGTNDAAVLSSDTVEPDRDQRGGRHQRLGHADHQRRRQRGDLRGAGRHRRHLRHVLDRRRRRLDLHGQLGPRRVRRRHHLHRHLRVASADGTLTSVTVNILGTNDAAVLSADTVEPDRDQLAADITTTGTLTISDVDSPATFVAQTGTAGTYGTFAIDADGAWTYTASSAHNEFAAGTTYTDTFAVASCRRHADLGHRQHPRHQRRGGAVGRHRRT